jgi:hypothetical protein
MVFIEMKATCSMFYSWGDELLEITAGQEAGVDLQCDSISNYSFKMAAPLDGLDAKTYRPSSFWLMIPRSILDL